MNYPLHAPTTDPTVLALREKREQARRELNRLDAELEAAMPTPRCRLCKVRACIGPFRWDVCGYCYNKHGGLLPMPVVDSGPEHNGIGFESRRREK